ncbi:hypothetical protein K8I61_19530 [bacterium]|nr:hypothetical protein [bacterium]
MKRWIFAIAVFAFAALFVFSAAAPGFVASARADEACASCSDDDDDDDDCSDDACDDCAACVCCAYSNAVALSEGGAVSMPHVSSHDATLFTMIDSGPVPPLLRPPIASLA